MDINCGTILDGEETVEQAGRAHLRPDPARRGRRADQERAGRLRSRGIRPLAARRYPLTDVGEDAGMTDTEAARRARALAEDAMHAQARGDYPEAERLLSEAQELDPDAVAVVLGEHDAAVAPDARDTRTADRDAERVRRHRTRCRSGRLSRQHRRSRNGWKGTRNPTLKSFTRGDMPRQPWLRSCICTAAARSSDGLMSPAAAVRGMSRRRNRQIGLVVRRHSTLSMILSAFDHAWDQGTVCGTDAPGSGRSHISVRPKR